MSCPTNSNRVAHRLVGVLPPHHAHDDDRSPTLRRAAGPGSLKHERLEPRRGICARVDARGIVRFFMKSSPVADAAEPLGRRPRILRMCDDRISASYTTRTASTLSCPARPRGGRRACDDSARVMGLVDASGPTGSDVCAPYGGLRRRFVSGTRFGHAGAVRFPLRNLRQQPCSVNASPTGAPTTPSMTFAPTSPTVRTRRRRSICLLGQHA